jgi:hypothetical protein
MAVQDPAGWLELSVELGANLRSDEIAYLKEIGAVWDRELNLLPPGLIDEDRLHVAARAFEGEGRLLLYGRHVGAAFGVKHECVSRSVRPGIKAMMIPKFTRKMQCVDIDTLHMHISSFLCSKI